ncbi:MAG TPA: hypothetical protein VGG62_03205 [Terracidiphilus sp.]
MAESRPSFWRRHRWLTILGATAFAVVVVIGVALAILARRVEPILRAGLVQGLQDRFHTRVELDHFHVTLGNGLNGEWGIWANGRGLRIWPPGHTDGDEPLETAVQSIPLITLDDFRFHVPLHYRPGQTIHIARVRLAGLRIVVPPRSERDKFTGIESAVIGQKPSSASSGHDKGNAQKPAENVAAQDSTNNPEPQPSTTSAMLGKVIVDRIDCENAQLILETDKPDKLPLEFAIASMQFSHVVPGEAMAFKAELTNPKPRGLIHSTGSLGPWQTLDPGETPVTGTYTFDHADLSTFRGIAGILSSSGNYTGTLRDIEANGKADVPDFRLSHFGNPVALHTEFHAKVDGTNGDTWLNPVEATLGHSHFTTRGQVVRVKRPNAQGRQDVSSANLPPLADQGHDIQLKVDVDRGRIEDFLRLANRSPNPILSGELSVKASLHIPPGKAPVYQRIIVDGTFKLDEAKFSSDKIQGRIEELSLRGQGHPGDIKKTDPDQVSSQMDGEFHMASAVITLPDIHYNVPGAAIQLQGHYALEGLMNFQGTARMQATVSQMVGGWKGVLLKPADHFFKKDGAGTLVPIEIRGQHDSPEFSIDFGRLKKSSPETPGQKQP